MLTAYDDAVESERENHHHSDNQHDGDKEPGEVATGEDVENDIGRTCSQHIHQSLHLPDEESTTLLHFDNTFCIVSGCLFSVLKRLVTKRQ